MFVNSIDLNILRHASGRFFCGYDCDGLGWLGGSQLVFSYDPNVISGSGAEAENTSFGRVAGDEYSGELIII